MRCWSAFSLASKAIFSISIAMNWDSRNCMVFNTFHNRAGPVAMIINPYKEYEYTKILTSTESNDVKLSVLEMWRTKEGIVMPADITYAQSHTMDEK